MEETQPSSDSVRSALLGDPALRTALERFVRNRVPENDAEDVVQATLTDAFAASKAPDKPEELRRWVHGIAKNKIVDLYRKRGREPLADDEVGDEAAAESAPISARDLLRWAEQELPDGEHAESTLKWMLREGSGEKLESIAQEEGVPAPRIRQRVSRMRQHFRTRWAAQIAAVAALVLVIGTALWYAKRAPDTEIAHEPPVEPTPEHQAKELRRAAYESCEAQQWRKCIETLDEAKRLDPKGDTQERVAAARRAAARGLAPPKQPAPVQKVAPKDAPAKEKPEPIRGKAIPKKLQPIPNKLQEVPKKQQVAPKQQKRQPLSVPPPNVQQKLQPMPKSTPEPRNEYLEK